MERERFREVHDELRGDVIRTLRRFGVPMGTLEDAAQEVFLVLYRRLPVLVGELVPRAWLRAVARKVAHDRRRSEERRRMRERAANASSSDAAVEEWVGADEILQRLLASAHPSVAAAFLLAELEQRPIPEIASLLGEPVRSIRARLVAAFDLLRGDVNLLADQRGYRRLARGAQRGEIGLRVLWPLARWIEDFHGSETLTEVAGEAGIDASELGSTLRWGTTAQARDFVVAAARLMPDDEAFERAVVYRIDQTPGPLRVVLRRLHPSTTHRWLARSARLIYPAARWEVVDETARSMLAYYSPEDATHEHRLLCRMRQAQLAAFPTVWGRSPYRVVEDGCVCVGGARCAYRVTLG